MCPWESHGDGERHGIEPSITDPRRRAGVGLAVDRRRRGSELPDAPREADISTIRALTSPRAGSNVLSIIAHDLRNELNVIGLEASMLAREVPEPLRPRAESLRGAAHRLNGMLTDLLAAAELDQPDLDPDVDAHDLAELVREAVDGFDERAAERRVALVLSSPVLEAPTICDPARVRSLLANLVNNAIELTPAGGRVRLAIAPRGDEWCVSVHDGGPGIDAEELPHVFERHWVMRDGTLGAGMGLHVAKSIVESQRGRIWAESGPRSGSAFVFALPAAQAGD